MTGTGPEGIVTDDSAPEPPAVSAEEIDRFFASVFGERRNMPAILLAERGRVVIRLAVSEKHLRPGGFISGPTQMGLADHAAYLAVFTEEGITPMALTSNLNIHFLRPAQGSWLEADARILKSGRSGTVVDVALRGEQSPKLTSHATVTYVLPRKG